jgi:hypothetical protein
MSAHRSITINCDKCSRDIITDGFDDIPEARREAKKIYDMKVYRVKNGSLWDFCSKCAAVHKQDNP